MNQLFSGSPNAVSGTRWAPGFQTNTKILSYEGLNYDNKPVFQDYGWLETDLDGRAYIPVFSDQTLLRVELGHNNERNLLYLSFSCSF